MKSQVGGVTQRLFTRFYHDVEEALIRAKLNGTQIAIVLAIQRRTIGWNKPEGAYISLSLFANLTGRHWTSIQRERKRLIDMCIVVQVRKPTFGSPAKWKLNDKPETWVLANTLTGSKNESVSQSSNESVSENAYQPVSKSANHIKKELKKEEERALHLSSIQEDCKKTSQTNPYLSRKFS